ncbi:MAG: bifunctional methylenetetrahydrofolate dehydrogenase/methenyltetrahydrofolate cyclohydrolase FolD [Clostridia bacterium]|nr:bifunctional methylenetetrahydrofolate dehydrogenase/methenyltetrahydrofolate cyclohydrolase FolD [Clostridia bacterium]
MKLISGKEVSQIVKDEIKKETQQLLEKQIKVKLAVVIVGDDPASHIYVRNKKKACEYVGFESVEYALPEDTAEDELLEIIDKLNEDETVNGILCQLPLPKHIDEKKVINAISPLKDVDAFHPVNVGKIMIGDYDFLPCTPAGIMRLIESTGYDVNGKDCVVIGRSNIVGKPMSMLMLQKNATVTICHSRTSNINEKIKNADIVIAAVGIPEFVKGDMVKDGALVIDVGINRKEDGKLCGDVDFDEVSKKASYITPVPGGVGPMTIAMLMQNTLKAAKLHNNIT